MLILLQSSLMLADWIFASFSVFVLICRDALATGGKKSLCVKLIPSNFSIWIDNNKHWWKVFNNQKMTINWWFLCCKFFLHAKHMLNCAQVKEKVQYINELQNTTMMCIWTCQLLHDRDKILTDNTEFFQVDAYAKIGCNCISNIALTSF